MSTFLARAAMLALLTLSAPAQAAEWPDLTEPAPRVGGGAQDAALVVGIADYDEMPDIAGADANALAWYRWLKETRGVSAVKLLRNGEASREDILAEAAAVAGRVQPGGTLWFVFIGHGAPAEGEESVLVGEDANRTARSLYARSVSRAELNEVLGRGDQAQTVMVLDACFSGTSSSGEALVPELGNSMLSGTWRGTPATVLTAARGDQFSGPLPGAARPAFSYLLLGALRGWGDGDGDGQVTAGEAIRWVDGALFDLVKGRSQQPELVGGGQELVLGRGKERAPSLEAFIVGEVEQTATAVVAPGGMSVGSSGGSGDLADQLAQLDLARRQREALEVQQAEAARKEQEILARLQAEREAKLDAAEAVKQRDAAETWRSMAPLVNAGGPEAKQAVELFVKEYGSAKVWVDDTTGRHERSVRSPDVAKAQAWLGSYRGDTGPVGDDGIEWISIPRKSFEMARSEVTVRQYQACVEAGACTAPDTCDWGEPNWGVAGREDHPVNCVDWNQASAFAKWAGGRLPTEDEWEYAAKGGQRYEYAGSKVFGDVAWTSENSGGSTHEVCLKRQNGYGLCDMSGNVWEWTSTVAGSNRVLRGGSWNAYARDARVAVRGSYGPGYRIDFLGFRPVR